MALKILFISSVWPEPESSAAGARSMSLIQIFAQAGWEIHFASTARKDAPFPGRLRTIGVNTHEMQPNDDAFDPWIAGLAPDVVLLERFMIEEQFGWRVEKSSPSSLRVLDTVDLHFLRKARQIAFSAGITAGCADNDTALREIASIYRSDLSLLISAAEVEVLTDHAGAFRVPAELLTEFGLCYSTPPTPRPEDERAGFCFIGNFRHEPNADAVRWLKQEIWPQIRARLPQARLAVYGAYPSREFTQLEARDQGFELRGSPPDAFDALGSHLVNLAPLRFGAGLKGKISDGWWSGTPCVSTEIGAEGMTLEDGSFGGLIVGEGASAFAEAACRLYGDEEQRAVSRSTGYKILKERFDHGTNSARLLETLDKARLRMRERRAANFVGRMLAHHAHRSTEYFSRWIEAKNRFPKA